MAYEVGDVVCLWQEDVKPAGVTVLKEVLVTITEAKTGVPGHWSRTPVSSTSLRGLGDDGKIYEKHWESWPEAQLQDFIGQWSMRDDGDGEQKWWFPKEATYAYNALKLALKQHPDMTLERRDRNGQPILPKGDAVLCEKHDYSHHKRHGCFYCSKEERQKVA